MSRILLFTRKGGVDFGQVASATIIRDKVSGRSRGFGFIEMPNKAEAHAAISRLNGKELKGQPIIVFEAPPEGWT